MLLVILRLTFKFVPLFIAEILFKPETLTQILMDRQTDGQSQSLDVTRNAEQLKDGQQKVKYKLICLVSPKYMIYSVVYPEPAVVIDTVETPPDPFVTTVATPLEPSPRIAIFAVVVDAV